MVQQGKTDLEIDFGLLEYGSEQVASYLYDNAAHDADFNIAIANATEMAMQDGANIPDGLEKIKKLRSEGRYVRNGLKKIFPNIGNG